MRVRVATFIVLGLSFAGCGGIPAFASSQFEADDEGWTLSGNGDATHPTLNTSGGNPDGHICGQDMKDGDIWYFVAPAKYLGNAKSTWGKRLTFDLKQGSIFNQIRGRDVVLNGGGLSIVMNFRAAPGLDWTPYSFRIDDQSGWVLESENRPATADELQTLLGSLTALRIRGEFFDGPSDVACLDNVYFGRE